MTTNFQKHNLALVAKYLMELYDGYDKFDMQMFHTRMDIKKIQLDMPIGHGEKADTLGHGPAAGVPIEQDSWNQYREVNFSHSSEVYCWLFSELWATYDNTPVGAAKRIIALLRYGMGDEINETIWIDGGRLIDIYPTQYQELIDSVDKSILYQPELWVC